MSKIGLRRVLSWHKLGLKPKFHDPGTFDGFGKREQTHTQTDPQDSCFISIDLIESVKAKNNFQTFFLKTLIIVYTLALD